MKTKRLVFILLISLISFNGIAQTTEKIKQLDAYFEKARVDWQVPGLAVAIVTKDSILLSKGYGLKDVNKQDPVDANTLFAVASNSKSFTAASIALLVDQGKLSWDDKVVDHLPWFRLYDPYVTQNINLRDILSHRSGLVTFSGDLVWYGTTHSRKEIIKRARYLKPRYGFRTTYGYSNIMYLTAGEVVSEVSGKTWDDFIKENFLKPLGMNSTLTSIKDFNEKSNAAQPHNDYKDKVIKIDYLDWDNIAPAGSILSSANDMSKWMQFQLNNGKVDEKQIVSEKNLNEMRQPHIMNPVSKAAQDLWPTTHFRGYGMGWSLMDYNGMKVMSHSGGYDGMISYTAFIPEANLGIVILTNKNSSLYQPLFYSILDAFTGDSTRDWSAFYLERDKKSKEEQEKEKLEDAEKRVKGTKPTLELSKYVGTYKSKLYGEATVGLKDGSLYLQFVQTPIFHGKLNHWHYDTFSIELLDVPSLPEGKVNFVLNAAGEVEQLRVDIPNPDFDFTELEFFK